MVESMWGHNSYITLYKGLYKHIHVVQQPTLKCVNAFSLNTNFKCCHKADVAQQVASANIQIYSLYINTYLYIDTCANHAYKHPT